MKKPYTPNQITKLLCKTIKLGDSKAQVKAHDVRKLAAIIAYLRCNDVTEVQIVGQWTTCQTFVTRYILSHISDIQCVAMRRLPELYKVVKLCIQLIT